VSRPGCLILTLATACSARPVPPSHDAQAVTAAPATVGPARPVPEGRTQALRALARPDWIRFNQHEIEDLWFAAGAFDDAERALVARSERTAALHWLDHERPSTDRVRFEDPRSVFEHVWASLPPVAIVYPTEQYYYWRFDLRQRSVGGNIRLVDADRGILHVGYFDRADQAKAHYAPFGAGEDVGIEPLGEGRYRIQHAGREVEFVLARRALGCAGIPALLKHETCITGILDESGIPLKLLYDSIHRSFSFVLNEGFPRIDALVPVEGTSGSYLLDRRTDFVFYADPRARRTLLVAVSSRNVHDNNYFDGPFDQVPPRLALKEKLEAAYPYLELDPIDAHGNFTRRQGQRVAISPYLDYSSLDDAVAELTRREKSAVLPSQKWAALTYESKRDFHRTLARRETEDAAGHRLYVSQGWPANHALARSQAWPASHQRAQSSGWPANADATAQPSGIPADLHPFQRFR
jgi:hypothetical protein